MGYIPPSAADLIRQDLSPILYELYAVFGTSREFLRLTRPPTPRTVSRMWADRHLDALGWGLIGSVYALLGIVVWLVIR